MVREDPRSLRMHVNESNRKGDTRTQYQRDRDRILHSQALRRLANVTQVVDPGEGHVFHNRLTHTLKVAQIARRLAEKLLITQKQIAEDLHLDPDVVEAAALAHDLGHPPFGHVAEQELDHAVKYQELLDGYEGNPQSFRILTKLEVRDTSAFGIDLTRATLNAVLKYPRLRQLQGEAHKKWGAYSTESSELKWTRKQFRNSEERSVEAELMDWADDIAFSLHDAEDFYRAGLIPPTIFSEKAPVQDMNEYLKEVISLHQRGRKQIQSFDELYVLYRDKFLEFRHMLPFASPFRHTQHEHGLLRFNISQLIDRYINGLQLNPESRGNPKIRTVIIDSDFRDEIRLLKGLTWRYVIHNPALASQQFGKRTVIRELFAIYFSILKSPDEELRFVLPGDYHDRLKHIEEDLEEDNEEKRKKQAKARLVADIISSMTDHEALLMHKRLKGLNPGSVLERIPH